MRGINKVILVATLGQDPEVRYNDNGGAMASFSAATNEQWTDRQSGEKQERTEWHRCIAFGRLGEIVGEYLQTGSVVYVEGKLQTRKWQDSNGQDRYTTEIVASVIQMLGGGRDNGNNGGNRGNQGSRGNQGNQGNQGNRGGNQGNRGNGGGGRGNQGGGRGNQGGRGGGNQGGRPAQGGGGRGNSNGGGDNFDDFDDDIPF